MALEDLAMMRAVFGSIVLYPCDGNQTGHLLEHMLDHHGISYMRTTREKTPVIYGPDEQFPIGGSKVLRQSNSDKVTVVGAGITLHEALKAHDELQSQGIAIRVIDAYSVKPIDAKTLRAAAAATNGQIVVVEDHWASGGLGDAVLEAFSGSEDQPVQQPLPKITKLAVHSMPGSGKPEELLNAAGIDAAHIVATVKKLAS
jgi:transketolase